MTYSSFCKYRENKKSYNDWAYSFANRIILFFEVGVSRVIHFERGLDLNALGLASGVYVVELFVEHNGTILSVKRKLVYIKK
jgi:hypothetical protein